MWTVHLTVEIKLRLQIFLWLSVDAVVSANSLCSGLVHLVIA